MRCDVDMVSASPATVMMAKFLQKVSDDILDAADRMDALTEVLPTHPENREQYQRFRAVLYTASAVLLMGMDELVGEDSLFKSVFKTVTRVRREKVAELLKDGSLSREGADAALEAIKRGEAAFDVKDEVPPAGAAPSVN